MKKTAFAALILFTALNVSAKEPFKVKNIAAFNPVAEVVYFPDIGVESEVEIGQTIVSKAKQLGANEMMPAVDIPGVGRIAMMTDPQGVAFAFMTPAPTM